MLSRALYWPDEALLAFDRWFCSKQGVYQTLVGVLIIVALESLFPGVDRGGLLLLYWLTVYSAVTQPALAHTGAESSARLQRMEEQNQQMMDTILALTERIEVLVERDLQQKESNGETTSELAV